MLTIYNPIGTSFVCGFQLSNKSLYYTCLKYYPWQLFLSLFNPYINVTSQSSLQLIINVVVILIIILIIIIYNLYS